jgi:hypothetical protein
VSAAGWHGIRTLRHNNLLLNYHTIMSTALIKTTKNGQLRLLPIQFGMFSYNIPVSDRRILAVNDHGVRAMETELINCHNNNNHSSLLSL